MPRKALGLQAGIAALLVIYGYKDGVVNVFATLGDGVVRYTAIFHGVPNTAAPILREARLVKSRNVRLVFK